MIFRLHADPLAPESTHPKQQYAHRSFGCDSQPLGSCNASHKQTLRGDRVAAGEVTEIPTHFSRRVDSKRTLPVALGFGDTRRSKAVD